MSKPPGDELFEQNTDDDPLVAAENELRMLAILLWSPRMRERYQLEERIVQHRWGGLCTGRVLGMRDGLEEGRSEGQLTEARVSVRRVLARRQLTRSREDEARIDACDELETLQRWLDQSVVAASAAEALA
jgi:hypothetical protein